MEEEENRHAFELAETTDNIVMTVDGRASPHIPEMNYSLGRWAENDNLSSIPTEQRLKSKLGKTPGSPNKMN
jgi:hypothetical protein